MKLSLNWIADFVDIRHIDPYEIAERLTMATAEVEEVEIIERAYKGKVVAEITKVTQLPVEGKQVALVTVDKGDGETVRTVCTAPNARVGLKCILALPGTALAGGQVVEVTELYGTESQGVLCSPKEVGMGSLHEKLLECPDDTEVGAMLADLLPERDVMLDIDNKSVTHRADLWGQYGFAREVAAIYKLPLKPLPAFDFDSISHLPAYSQAIGDNRKINCLTSVAFDFQGRSASSLEVQERLFTMGQKCIGLLVDLTNYVALEVGQPTHVHDREKCPSIQAISLDKPQTIKALDKKDYQLQQGDLAISNGEALIGLAGVIGGNLSELTEGSSQILLESANFQAQQVRRTATRLGLRTEASQRFEKSLPPAFTRMGAARLVQMVTDNVNCSVEFKSSYTITGDAEESYRSLELDAGFISALAGTEISQEKTTEILNSLDFTVEPQANDKVTIGIPPFRSKKDISVSNDIGEEVLRIYGYDNLPSIRPALPIRPVIANNLMRHQHRLRRYLAGYAGFVEVQTYTWMDEEWNKKLGYSNDNLLRLKNPVAEGKEQLREYLLPNLLPLVNKNWPHSDHFKLFETGSIFLKDPETGKSDEKVHLGGVCFAQQAVQSLEQLFHSTKGVLESLGTALGIAPFSFDIDTKDSAYTNLPWSAKEQWGRICYQGKEIGAMGIVQPKLLKSIVKSGQIVWFELNLEFLRETSLYASIHFEDLPVYHDTKRDYTLECAEGMSYHELEEKLDKFEHAIMKKRSFLSAFSSKENKSVAYTFRYHIGLKDRTLDTEDINDFHDSIQAFFKKEQLQMK